MAELKEIESFFHPLIFHSPLESPINASKKKRNSYISRSCTTASIPLLTNIFLLSLISFFTIMSIFFLMATISISNGNNKRQSSLLESLFEADSSSTLPSHPLVVQKKMSKEEVEFWKQQWDQYGGGYKQQSSLCLDFSFHYRKSSVRVSKEKRRFLVVVISSSMDVDLFQLRNQIIHAVLFSRILGAALVVPYFKRESGFSDRSDFADIFDEEHFIRTLRSDVRVVASHPYTHLTSNEVKGFELPRHVNLQWIRTKFRKQLNDNGVLVLNGFESELSGKPPQDLLKLRCKVAFDALRFSNPIREIGYKLAKRLWIEGPYAAFDLGLNNAGKNLQFNAKYQHEHLKAGLLVGNIEQKIAEMVKRLKGMGVPRSATLYAATAGSKETLKPFIDEFPNLVSMETLARVGELLPFVNSSYALAAVDYIVSLNSNVFLVTEDTHLTRALLVHRAYSENKKVVNLFRPELTGCGMRQAEFKLFGLYKIPKVDKY